MDIRTLVLGLGVFCATFVVGWWFNIGAALHGTRASQPQPVVAGEAAATSGQGQSQAQPAQRYVVHRPVSTGAQNTATEQPKMPLAAKLPQVKYAQQPKAKASTANSASSKPAVRVRRR
jgi:hypothetical protein